jgi:transposase-like protein
MENQSKVKSPLVELREEVTPLFTECCSVCLIRRHGGLIREGEDTIRVRNGGYRCPRCVMDLYACSPVPEPITLPTWHDTVERYLSEVGTHGIPDADRPQQCPNCLQCTRTPHRHSKYERTVITLDEHFRISIFRFRCSDCRYVHSVIPAFLEPYQRLSLDVQEDLVDAIVQGATLEAISEASAILPSGPYEEKTISRLVQGWNERLAQLESGLWPYLLARVPHLVLERSTSLWQTLRSGWESLRLHLPWLADFRFLQGLNRLCFSLTVTVHG